MGVDSALPPPKRAARERVPVSPDPHGGADDALALARPAHPFVGNFEIDSRVIDRLNVLVALMKDAARDAIKSSYEGVPVRRGQPLPRRPTHELMEASGGIVSPALVELSRLTLGFSRADVSALLTWMRTWLPAPRDFVLPCSADELFAASTPDAPRLRQIRFTVSDLEGDMDRVRRERLHAAFLAHPAADLLPVATAPDNLEDWLHRLVQPWWRAGQMIWTPTEEHGVCPITNNATRFYGHPYTAEVAHLQYEVLRERFGDDVRMLGLVVYADATTTHGKKLMNVVVGLLPKADAFRSDRARETCLLIPSMKVPPEIKAPAALNVARRLSAALFHHAMYDGLIGRFNEIVDRGGAWGRETRRHRVTEMHTRSQASFGSTLTTGSRFASSPRS